MSSTDQIREWGADHIIDAMRQDQWFALAVFSTVASATGVAKVAAAFGEKARENGAIVSELDNLPARLRRLADIFETQV